MAKSEIKMKPYLRWAGGKRQIVQKLIDSLPNDIDQRTYYEPFLGAGCLFFALGPKHAVLSDANEHLIEVYRFVRENPDLINSYLRRHLNQTSKSYYYQVRVAYNWSNTSAAQAARFIYLNKTCFNGIFRVNKRGQFNVPYGYLEPPNLPTLEELRRTSRVLKSVHLSSCSFEHALENCGNRDFVYLDPPYPPLNNTSYFTHYTPNGFGDAQQSVVASLVHRLDRKKTKVMITNADTPLIRRLFRSFRIEQISVRRNVTCRAKRHSVHELVITNY